MTIVEQRLERLERSQKRYRVATIGLLCLILSALTAIPIGAQTAIDADFDKSGKVDFADFIGFAGAYNTTDPTYDLNGNGRVDFSDFLAFAGFFGQETVSPTLTVALTASASIDLVYISPGTFTMGSPSGEVLRESDEGPQHEVTISKGFYLGKYEVTQGQWEAVMGTTPWSGLRDVRANANNPAVYVSWDDAQVFVQKLNAAAGGSLYRLPSEAEWEYVCRAGKTTRWSFGDDESKLGKYAWYYYNAWDVGEQYGHTVGTKLANPWGLYDMHGNVWEWCGDWFGSSYYSSSPSTDPQGPSSLWDRVFRGGALNYSAQNVRSANRDSISPGNRYSSIGFRLLRIK